MSNLSLPDMILVYNFEQLPLLLNTFVIKNKNTFQPDFDLISKKRVIYIHQKNGCQLNENKHHENHYLFDI